MELRAGIEKIIRLKRPGIAVRLLLLPLVWCSWAYGAAMRLRAWLYRACVLESGALPCRVISVGNITVGGTGKTPTVCLLAKLLAARDIRVCVVNRGYRGTSTREPVIVSDGARVLATAEQAGDEAVMLARKLQGIPVISCRDRMAAGQLACERFSAQAVLLDDGFQHLRLRRDLDIVLINAVDPFGSGHVLPRGILREPLAALGRAGIIVLTKAAGPGGTAELRGRVHRTSPSAPVYTASYAVTGFRRCLTGDLLEPEQLSGKKLAALCSIGDPDNFTGMLARAGLSVAEQLVYPDHHCYGPGDYNRIRAASDSADFVVTTEKDIAKLDARVLKKFIVMEIEQVIDSADSFLQEVLSRSGLAQLS